MPLKAFMALGHRTFHFSISFCCFLYCLRSSSSTFLRPSEFVFSAGMTSFTVLSTKIPFNMRKHFRSEGSGSSVSSTNLSTEKRSACVLAVCSDTSGSSHCRTSLERKRKKSTEKRSKRTYAPPSLAQHPQFFVPVVARYSCNWCTVAAVLSTCKRPKIPT